MEFHIAMLILVLVLDPSTWTMLLVLQVLVSYWSALAGQSQVITVFTLLMLVLGVKVILSEFKVFQQNSAIILSLQFHVQLVNCDWWVVTLQMRAEWRSV